MVSSPPLTTTTAAGFGPIAPSDHAALALRPLGSARGGTREGFWWTWLELNRSVTLLEGSRQLEAAGNLHNFRLAADEDTGTYRGPLYLDSDVYKWLEAVAWEQQRRPEPHLHQLQEEISALIARAQEADGYLNTYVQTGNAERYADLALGHELFCGGHLIQGAIAQRRATRSDTLFDVAVRYADHLVASFGPGRIESTDGHPEIEMALVELYRETAKQEYLDLATFLIDVRGRHTLTTTHRHADYYQDDLPVRQTPYLRGHAVRAVFLAAGVTDLAIEADDAPLVSLMREQWQDMVERKTYLTGGIGSRWEGEAFGNGFELGSEVAYAETCAAHASVLWSWRMLLATGHARYADLIERTLYNAFLPGLGLDGRTFFYVNTLQTRPGTANTGSRSPLQGRQPWFSTACCPPNIMRTIASIDHLRATQTSDALQVHFYTSGTIGSDPDGAGLEIDVLTDLPHGGSVRIEITGASDRPVTLSLRIPDWSTTTAARVNGDDVEATSGAYLDLERTWSAGDTVEIDLDVRPRYVRADPRIDAIGAALAIERGPLVYCFEQADQSVDLDALSLDGAELREEWRPDLLGGVHVVVAPATASERAPRSGRLPYGQPHEFVPASTAPAEMTAVPYYAWANREVGAMRVFVPVSTTLP